MVSTRSLVALIALSLPLAAHAVQFTVSAGAQQHSVSWDTGLEEIDEADHSGTGYHFGVLVHNHLGSSLRHRLGVGVDYDEVDSMPLLGLRAVDYQYLLNSKVRLGAFIGAASLDSGFPQNGYYLGGRASWDFNREWSLVAEFRHANGLARDRRGQFPPDELKRPDVFADVSVAGLQLEYRF